MNKYYKMLKKRNDIESYIETHLKTISQKEFLKLCDEIDTLNYMLEKMEIYGCN